MVSLRGGHSGAASVIRTRDLTLTKGALYRWSYGSVATMAIAYTNCRHLCKQFICPKDKHRPFPFLTN